MSVSGEQDMDTKAKSPIQERPASPVPSCVSMKSDWSMDPPLVFRDKGITTKQRQQRPASPVPSCVSMKSDGSMEPPLYFSDGGGPSNEEGLTGCHITEEGCASLGSVLKSTSFLRQLDLSNNDLKDAGMKLLSAGLGYPLCKLETLRLSGCLVTEEGCASLASALKSNPFHLRELDLSYNHPGEKGLKLLSAGLEDPHCRLEKLNVDHGRECRIKPGLRKYACEITLDPNTAHRNLSLSEENRKVTWRREEQPYPDHPERFEKWTQVLCREGLSGRCYWEAERREGGVYIAVTYKGISRRGECHDCGLGYYNKSWSLFCGDDRYTAWHNDKSIVIPVPPSSSHRVGVYLDWPAGTLSFYRVSSDTLTHLHTFHSTFTEPLYPGFRVHHTDSSVSLCQVE